MGTLAALLQLQSEWGLYVAPNFEKMLKQSPQKANTSSSDENSLQRFLWVLRSFEVEQVPFVEFVQKLSSESNLEKLLNHVRIQDQSTLLHLIAKYNHLHLFEQLKQFKSAVDINVQDHAGQTPLSVALNEKHFQMVDRILREFKDYLDLGDPSDAKSALTPRKT